MHEADESLTREGRMELFRALVEAQDGEMSAEQSRRATAQRFGVSELEVCKIEQGGLEADWPPL
jgi:hypothetical protein